MNINLFPFTILWMLLAMIVAGLMLYRKWVSKDEEDSIHVMDNEAAYVLQQVIMAAKLDVIDHWGKTLTVVVLVYGVGMGSIYLYQAWLIGETAIH